MADFSGLWQVKLFCGINARHTCGNNNTEMISENLTGILTNDSFAALFVY